MGQKPDAPGLTVELNWQRLLTACCVVLGLCVIAYGLLVRPAVSTYVGRQVSQQLSEEIASELTQAVVAGMGDGPAPAARGAGVGQQAAATGAGGEGVAPAGEGGGAAIPGQAAPTRPAGQIAIVGGAPESGAAGPQAQASAVAQAVLSQLQGTARPDNPDGSTGPGREPASPSTPGATIGVPGASPPAPPVASPAPVVGTPIVAPPSERSIQEIVAALPPGELVVTEQKLNEKIAPRVARMAPLERVEVHFVPGTVQVTLAVFGRVNLATAGLTISGNRVVVQNPRIEGPLGLLVSPADLVRPIEEELNDTLELADRQVHTVRIEQGQIVVTLS
ncbi:MAG TPA: hypothetical protein PKD53_00900 [Chloroflexaceae bacterium]|nr:hypothetical protein [Chloroflexaceae bacterium]